MARQLAGPVLLLAGTVAVVWSGLAWPPPLWIVEYGLPGSQGPTGRVAVVEGIEFVEVSPGYFRMGSDYLAIHAIWQNSAGDLCGRLSRHIGLPWGTASRPSWAMPLRWVEFPRGFWMSSCEVTNERYSRLVPDHARSEESCEALQPVNSVTWDESRAYSARLARRSGLPIRLPSEAEWEAACRAGSTSLYCFGDDEAGLIEYAWTSESASRGPGVVGRLEPNAWGLFDLHGNLLEWCEDTSHASYENAPTDGSAWTSGEDELGYRGRVYRGGSWRTRAGFCLQSAHRYLSSADAEAWDVGFRLAFSLGPGEEPLIERYLVKERPAGR